MIYLSLTRCKTSCRTNNPSGAPSSLSLLPHCKTQLEQSWLEAGRGRAKLFIKPQHQYFFSAWLLCVPGNCWGVMGENRIVIAGEEVLV